MGERSLEENISFDCGGGMGLWEKRGEEIFAELIVVLFGQQINVFFFFKGVVGISCGMG